MSTRNSLQFVLVCLAFVLILCALGVYADESPTQGPESGHVNPPTHLPSPLPDLEAMVRREKPVQLSDDGLIVTWGAGGEEAQSIWRRYMQGDREEALRLYKEYADEHPGSTDAAIALFHIARALVSYRQYESGQLDKIGNIAFRLAEENPTHCLAPRALYMYLSEMLRAVRERYEPSAEEWMRVFRAAAMLAGRYPDDVRGPECLVEVANILAGEAEARPQALEVYRLVTRGTRWRDAWDAKFRAYKALHDDALARGNLVDAEAIAHTAAHDCAGRLTPIRWRREAIAREEKPDTPWQKMFDEGVPSDGQIVLEHPPWKEGTRFLFAVSESVFDQREKKWVQAHRGEPVPEKPRVVYLLERQTDGLFAGVESASRSGPETPYASESRYRPGGASLAFLGDPTVTCPKPSSLLFMPKFPVREGNELFPCAGIGLVKQHAPANGDNVNVTIWAGGRTVWTQTWRKGEPWWDEAEVQYEDQFFSAVSPGRYDADPGWNRSLRKLRARRIAVPSASEIEKEALQTVRRRDYDDTARALILPRLREHFSGEELARLEAQSEGRPYPPTEDASISESERLEEVRKLLAQHDASAAIDKLTSGYRWSTRYEESALLRAEAFLAIDQPDEAAEVLRWFPRQGPFASAKARLLEAEAWEGCREMQRALLAAHGLLHDAPGSPEAAEVRTLMERLEEHEGALRETLEQDPYVDFGLRSLWRPLEGDSMPYDVKVEPYEGRMSLLVRDSRYARWHWRITPDGKELAPPTDVAVRGRDGRFDWHGTARTQFARTNDVIYAREGDRLIAEDPQGSEIWRYTVPTELPDETPPRRAGLPRLADPHLVRLRDGELILCGVGQREVSIGMGIQYTPVGGGLVALGSDGKPLYHKDIGYCEALSVVPRGDGAQLVVALFRHLTVRESSPEREEEVFLAGFEPQMGNELWHATLLQSKARRFGYRPHSCTLLTASMLDGSPRAVVSVSEVSDPYNASAEPKWRTHVLTADGTEVATIEGIDAALVADFDGDGTDELLGYVGARQRDGGQLSIIDIDGRTLWQGPEGRWLACCVEDLDNDGWAELLAVRRFPYRATAVAVFGKPPTNF